MKKQNRIGCLVILISTTILIGLFAVVIYNTGHTPSDQELKADTLEHLLKKITWSVPDGNYFRRLDVSAADHESIVLQVIVSPGGLYKDFRAETYKINFSKIRPVMEPKDGEYGQYLEIVEGSMVGGIIIGGDTGSASISYNFSSPGRLRLYYNRNSPDTVRRMLLAIREKINDRIANPRS
jgi:hypothetical protein